MNGSQVTIDHVSKKFGDFVALDDINFVIKPGEFFSLLGPSGCGKTTLLRIIAGFEFPDDGVVLFDDTNIIPLNPDKRPSNTVFQTYALFPHMTVYENVAFSLKLKKLPKEPTESSPGGEFPPGDPLTTRVLRRWRAEWRSQRLCTLASATVARATSPGGNTRRRAAHCTR